MAARTFSSMRQRAVALASSIGLAVAAVVVAAPAVAPAVTGGEFTPAVGVSPQVRYAGKPFAEDESVVFGCQIATAEYPCYGPDQIKHAYQIDQTGLTGAGRTIVIVDAFQNPYITQELHDFDAVWGIPDPPSFKIVAPDGLTPFSAQDANMFGWSGEISLDVQWAHAIAPAAKIVLVLAKSGNDADIVSALGYAIHHNLGDVISMSFGEAEPCFAASLDAKEHALFAEATAKRITLVASSGDDGAAQPGCAADDLDLLSTSTPAADPYVLGVGGTNLTADYTTGAYRSERAWTDEAGQSGGGFSVRYAKPQYQVGFQSTVWPRRTGRGLQRRRRRRGGRGVVRAVRPEHVLPPRRHERGRTAVVRHRCPGRPEGRPPCRFVQLHALFARSGEEHLLDGLPRHHGRQQLRADRRFRHRDGMGPGDGPRNTCRVRPAQSRQVTPRAT